MALLALSGAPGRAAPTDPVNLRYELYVRGLPIVSLDFRITETAVDYSVFSLIRSTGIVDWIADFVMRSESQGTIDADQLHPSVHESSSTSRQGGRLAHLDYAADGTVATAVTPAAAPNQPAPTAEQIAGTVDPLTAILTVRRAVARTGACNARVAVFDGRRRYDLVLADDGTEALTSAAGTAETHRCRVDIVKVAGFAVARGTMPHVSHGEVWLLPPDSAASSLPLRIDFASDWGPITVRMAPADPAR